MTTSSAKAKTAKGVGRPPAANTQQANARRIDGKRGMAQGQPGTNPGPTRLRRKAGHRGPTKHNRSQAQ
eukprot:11845934-Alexandrium_andersonii.AAC.1